MKKVIVLLMLLAFACTPGFDCDEEEEQIRSQISSLERTVEAERRNATNADHARRQAVKTAKTLQMELLAERTRRGWSDTYSIASGGACLLAFLIAAAVFYYKRKGNS